MDKARAAMQEQGTAIKEEARRVASEVSAEGAKAAEEIKAVGKDLSSAAMGKAEDLAERGKQAGVERGLGLAEATRHMAEDLEESSPEIARHVRAAADSIENITTSLRERSVSELMREATGFARRQPGAFFGAAVLAGFALARFAKSSADNRSLQSGSMGQGPTPDRAPGWVPASSGHAGAGAPLKPATMPAATLGGNVAHRPGTAMPGSMPTTGGAV